MQKIVNRNSIQLTFPGWPPPLALSRADPMAQGGPPPVSFLPGTGNAQQLH